MAYTSPTELDVGDPLKKEDHDVIRTDLDDLNSRTNNVESGAAKVPIFNGKILNASKYGSGAVLTGLDLFQADRSFTLTTAVVSVLQGGSTGTLEIDLLKASTLGGSFASVFTTKPSLAAGGGDNLESTNAVFSTTAVSQGDWLRLDVSSFMSSQQNFHITIFGEVS